MTRYALLTGFFSHPMSQPQPGKSCHRERKASSVQNLSYHKAVVLKLFRSLQRFCLGARTVGTRFMTGLDAGILMRGTSGDNPMKKMISATGSCIMDRLGVVSTNLRLDASRGRQTMPCHLTRHSGGRSSRRLLEIFGPRAP